MNINLDDTGGYSCSLCGCCDGKVQSTFPSILGICFANSVRWLVEVNNDIDHIRYRNWNRDSVLLCDTCLRTVREVMP